jgi:hypothetical protein
MRNEVIEKISKISMARVHWPLAASGLSRILSGSIFYAIYSRGSSKM